MKFSELAETLPGSPILAISNAVKKRIAAGEKIYNLTVGDFDPAIFPVPAILKQSIKKAYDDNATNYPEVQGNLDLRQSICAFTKSMQGIDYTTGEVLVGAGGRTLIYALYKCLVDPGDTVIYPVPGWNNHFYAQLAGANAVEIQATATNLFMPQAADIAPHLDGAVLLSLCSPQNPAGTCFTREGLAGICELVLAENKSRLPQEKKLYVLYDQMYHLLTHGDYEHVDPVALFPEMKAYTIYIDAISKSFAATGVRVGWALGPAPLINHMSALLTHSGGLAPMAEQKAVAVFLSDLPVVSDFLLSFKQELHERLQQLYAGVLEMKLDGLPVDVIAPQAGIYLSLRIDLPDAHEWLLEKAGIAILPFAVFGPKQTSWYRISVGTCRLEDIVTILEKMKRAMGEMQHYQNDKKFFILKGFPVEPVHA